MIMQPKFNDLFLNVTRALQRGVTVATTTAVAIALGVSVTPAVAADDQDLPIADVHIHYSHDSVDMTPPERVIELMRAANLKFALVSSSDDNGTQLLSALAPDIIVPGLRPYRKRGELSTWYQDDAALAYVERLLDTNRYATIGEFHLYGATADLPIPRRIVELAAEHNLILHAHSDADAVERLLAQDNNVKVIWAHSGFDEPEAIAAMLAQHDRLYADLAFRSDVGSGGSLSDDWVALFEAFPDRMMLGTDTYTPERMYYLPEHASNARRWLQSLSPALAERVAWKNAADLITPVWKANRQDTPAVATTVDCAINASRANTDDSTGTNAATNAGVVWRGDTLTASVAPNQSIGVSESFSATVQLCSNDPGSLNLSQSTIDIDAVMRAHGHGMNYVPEISTVSRSAQQAEFLVEGLVLHMPGTWEWQLTVRNGSNDTAFQQSFELQ